MEVISVIVSNKYSPVLSIDTFGVLDSESENEVSKQAENLFIEKCIELKFGSKVMQKGFEKLIDDYRKDLNDALEDGYEDVAMHTVTIVWSSIDNVQL